MSDGVALTRPWGLMPFRVFQERLEGQRPSRFSPFLTLTRKCGYYCYSQYIHKRASLENISFEVSSQYAWFVETIKVAKRTPEQTACLEAYTRQMTFSMNAPPPPMGAAGSGEADGATPQAKRLCLMPPGAQRSAGPVMPMLSDDAPPQAAPPQALSNAAATVAQTIVPVDSNALL